MGVGNLNIEGLQGDQRIDLGVGDVKLWADKITVQSVEIEAGVGGTKIHGLERHLQERRSNFIGSEIYWNDGEGDAKIDVEVGVGEATVWLE